MSSLSRILSLSAMVAFLSFGAVPTVQAQEPTPTPTPPTPAPTQPVQPAPQQMAQDDFLTVAEREGFREWTTGVRATGFDQRLADRPVTVFAARDEAYAQVPAQTRTAWQTDPAAHRAAVGHTIVEGRLTAEDLRQREYVTTIDGQRLPVRTVGDRIMVGDATIDRADIAAGPGVIHRVDRVLLPAEREPLDPVVEEPQPLPPAQQPAQPQVQDPAPAPTAPVREPVRKDWPA